MPSPRPCGATGNDARKLHALASVHVRGALFMHEVLLCKSIAKLRNAPFPRPCGATGNDVRKLHALAFARFRSAPLMHEVLYQILIIRHQQFHHHAVRLHAVGVTVGFQCGVIHRIGYLFHHVVPELIPIGAVVPEVCLHRCRKGAPNDPPPARALSRN